MRPHRTLPSGLVINADDLGYSDQVNDAVFDLMAEGRITSATMLANGQAILDAARRCKGFPQCSFGVHLCLTELMPISQAGRELPFVAGNGQFDSRCFAATRASLAVYHGIFIEWCEQIKFLRELGVPVSHIDSHHHVHTRPWLFPVLKRVQVAARIRKVRASLNLYLEEEHKPGWRLLAQKRLFNCALRLCYATSTTDIFTNFRWFEMLRSSLSLGGKTVELMTHPGSAGYQRETELLRSSNFDSLRPLLINYNKL
ncbi:MAG: ChbG/HpnK family deacetylase [Verrucomicrobiota bacterium]